jgi:exopolyphosphatase/guanosine-5'-triphosphate,3'-diphosphate pyrophosphatase
MLHDAGVMVDYNDHHRHGYYLVLNAGPPGFRHRELALVALLVRSHRKALASPRRSRACSTATTPTARRARPPACAWPSNSSAAARGSARCG